MSFSFPLPSLFLSPLSPSSFFFIFFFFFHFWKRPEMYNLLELRCIWTGPTQLINLNHLEILYVWNCTKLIHLFTPTLARSLQNLKILQINWCDKLEHLIVEDENDRILLGRHFQTPCFPKLGVVEVKECNKLKCLFPIMIAHNLLELSSLKIEGASQLVEVFECVYEGETLVQRDLFLPKLKDITLIQLPSLLNFCPKSYHAILPELQKLQVQSCLNMTKTFAPTPEQNVQVNGEVTHYTWSFYFFNVFIMSHVEKVCHQCRLNPLVT
jgi:hypothetical protein